MKKKIINEVKNSGLQLVDPTEKEYHGKAFIGSRKLMLGRISPLEEPPIFFKNSIGWKQVALNYGLPEIQYNRKFDTYTCVVYSTAKAIVYYLYHAYGIKTTISEMFNAFYAGVIPNHGTTIAKGMESFRNYGWVKDKEYPFTMETTAKQFFLKPPQKIKILAAGKLLEWNFYWEVLPPDLLTIIKHYRKTPVVLTGFAWLSYYGDSGVYYDDGNRANHAFLGLEAIDKNNLIDDTYPNNTNDYSPDKKDMFKELHNSFRYGSAHRCWVTPTKETHNYLITFIKNMFTKISRDTHGGFWFIKDGKKQKITNFASMLGAIIDEVGVKKNNLTDKYLATLEDYKFFGK